MKREMFFLRLSIITSLIIGLYLPAVRAAEPNRFELKQVLIFSRHGIRAPLVNSDNILAVSSPRIWPHWDTEGGLLTPKGGQVSENMGRYIRAWLTKNKFFSATCCPEAQSVFAYANNLPRTIETARHIVSGAFPGCVVPVINRGGINKTDPTFNPIITTEVNDSFRKRALDSVEQHAGEGGQLGLNLRLTLNYVLLEKILDYKHSKICEEKRQCDLSVQHSQVILTSGEKPSYIGPLRLADSAVDAFMLQYYEGFSMKDVAWGEINTQEKWTELETLKNVYHDMLFGSPVIATEVARPLLSFISATFRSNHAITAEAKTAQQAKLVLLVGHDLNIVSLLAALKTRDYTLPGQFEHAPISGMVVFQHWYDKETLKDLMKIEYVYPTAYQIRNNVDLSLATPPERVALQIEGCNVDKQGFCLMKDFKHALQEDLQN